MIHPEPYFTWKPTKYPLLQCNLGLSMDRIWGGFMDDIKEEGEDGKVPEPETPETKARRALNEKTKKRRRRRARNQMAPSAVKTTSKISQTIKIHRFSPISTKISHF